VAIIIVIVLVVFVLYYYSAFNVKKPDGKTVAKTIVSTVFMIVFGVIAIILFPIVGFATALVLAVLSLVHYLRKKEGDKKTKTIVTMVIGIVFFSAGIFFYINYYILIDQLGTVISYYV